MPIAISPISSIPVVQPAAVPAGARPGGFGAVLETAINSVENVRREGTETVEKFLAGEGGELHTTVLATQRAELSFQLFLQARNKVVDAYQEIMRMQM
jgi:flagellar hook-basal body complex protein FliE